MEAICKADFDRLVAAYLAAEREKARRKELAEKAEKEKRRRMKYQKSGKNSATAEDEPKEEEENEKEVNVPQFGFHDIYGIWFFGRLKAVIIAAGKERFKADLSKTMHVFINVEPKKLPDGIHDITVYGHQATLYKWTAQGYPRGLVVLKDDERGNQAALVYMESRTWSWVLDDGHKAKLESIIPKVDAYRF